jgi:maltose O-acetyltransferase
MPILSKLWPGLGRDLLLNSVIASPLFPRPLRWLALRAYGMDLDRCFISPNVWFGSNRVSIGKGTAINYHCMFNTAARISIGKNCDVAMGVLFVTSSHKLGGHDRRGGEGIAEPIQVGDGVWIGARCVILPGVTIGDGAVIAAGSVVNRDVDSDSLFGGVPAQKKKDLPI